MKIFILIKKELSFYFNSPLGYIVAILFAVFACLLFIKDLFLRGNSSMRPFFDILPWLYLIFIPALTMRIFSDEKRTNTIEVLLTLPISEVYVVVSKFLALLIFSAVAFALTISIPITLGFVSSISFFEIIVSYLGAIFMAASFISVSMFFSSLTKNQIIAFLCSALTVFFLTVIGSDFSTSFIPSFIQEKITIFSPLYHYEAFLRGILDIRALFYFISLTCLFLFLNAVNLEKRD